MKKVDDLTGRSKVRRSAGLSQLNLFHDPSQEELNFLRAALSLIFVACENSPFDGIATNHNYRTCTTSDVVRMFRLVLERHFASCPSFCCAGLDTLSLIRPFFISGYRKQRLEHNIIRGNLLRIHYQPDL